MSRLEKFYAQHFDTLSTNIMRMGGLVEDAIARSLRALVDRDRELAAAVIEADHVVNQLELDNDQLGLEILARYQPTARDLRFIVTAMQINTDIERMGDLAVNVAKRALELAEEPPIKTIVDIPAMGQRAQEMLRAVLDAFVAHDSAAARRVVDADDDLDRRMEKIFRELVATMLEDPRNVTRGLRLTFVAKSLERIGDQCTNIAELVVFMTEGRVIKHAALESGPARPKLPRTPEDERGRRG